MDEHLLLIDSADAPIFGIDTDGLVNEWNRKAAQITGFSKEEVIGHDLVRTFITEPFQASVGQMLQKALEGEDLTSPGQEDQIFPLFTKAGQRVEVRDQRSAVERGRMRLARALAALLSHRPNSDQSPLYRYYSTRNLDETDPVMLSG